MKFFTIGLFFVAAVCISVNAFSASESVPVATGTAQKHELISEIELEDLIKNVREAVTLKDSELEVRRYASALFARSENWRVPADKRKGAIEMLSIAFAQRLDGNSGDALDTFENVIRTFPSTLFAAEAIFQQSVIYTSRHQFDDGFSCVVSLVETYPGSDRISDAITQGFIIVKTVREGARPRRFGGRLPWFKDRHSVLNFYEKLYSLAPNTKISPRFLYEKGVFAASIAEDLFEGDRKLEAIDSLERLISTHPDSVLVPDGYLLLAGTYESLCIGADWDQVSSRRALNYYTDFYSLYPENPKAEFAYNKTEELRDLLAANRVVIGDFYYSRYNNLRAAVGFYREAITYAPDSPSGKDAREKIEKIRKGERAPRTIVDWLFGRYPATVATDFLDAPSQKSLDEMGFQTPNSIEDDREISIPKGTSEKQEYKDPSEK